jgi:hypothetical protein
MCTVVSEHKSPSWHVRRQALPFTAWELNSSVAALIAAYFSQIMKARSKSTLASMREANDLHPSCRMTNATNVPRRGQVAEMRYEKRIVSEQQCWLLVLVAAASVAAHAM